jgi:hypothetical protein
MNSVLHYPVGMFARRMWRRLKCLRVGHDWYEYKDYDRHYVGTSIPVQRRTCQHCGLSQVGIYGEYEMDWVSVARAEKAMRS